MWTGIQPHDPTEWCTPPILASVQGSPVTRSARGQMSQVFFVNSRPRHFTASRSLLSPLSALTADQGEDRAVGSGAGFPKSGAYSWHTPQHPNTSFCPKKAQTLEPVPSQSSAELS